MTEQEQLERITEIEELRWERKKVDASSPGQTESVAIFYLAMRGGAHGLLGIAIAGAVLGAIGGCVTGTIEGGVLGVPIFLVVGAVLGLVLGGVVGAIPVAVAASLFVATRGRLQLPAAMAWSGAVAGIGVYATMLPPYHRPLSFSFAELTLAVTLATFGAVGARWMTIQTLRGIRITHGRGVRRWRQFSIADLLLIMSWLAIACALAKGLLSWEADDYVWGAAWLAVSLVVTVMVEGVVLVSEVRRKPRSLRGSPRST